jgi:hypothetical protein
MLVPGFVAETPDLVCRVSFSLEKLPADLSKRALDV